AGKSVAISNGDAGNEAGDILWQAGSDLDYDGIGPGRLSLSIASDPSATGGSVTLGASIFDSRPASADGLNVRVSATRDLVVDGSIRSGVGMLSLAADVFPNGSGDDGVGTLSVGPAGAGSGSRVTLRGADVQLDTSDNPARFNTRQVSTVATGFSLPTGMAFDAEGNLYVSNAFGSTVSRVAPGGAVSTFASGLNGP